MKRIRDRIVAKEIEEKTGKKIEYVLPEDICYCSRVDKEKYFKIMLPNVDN